MKILRQNTDLNLVLNHELDFQMNLGWQENMEQFEDEVLNDIINPIDNYETVRYIHKPDGISESDIWFYFYFSNNGNYSKGLDYSLVGIEPKENAKMLRQSTESFFRLEFYKTSNLLDVNGNVTGYTAPTRQNRKLIFTKNLTLPLGEKYFYTPLQENIHVPVFHGSNYTNKENMYLFWFQDESVLAETNLSGTTTGNTFFMTAKFFNAKDGLITDFYNDVYATSREIKENEDMYFQVDIDKRDYSYKIYKFNGTKGAQVGTTSSPIKFYESGGGTITPPLSPTPTMTLTPTPTPTSGLELTQTPTPTPSATPAGVEGPVYRYYKLRPCVYQNETGFLNGNYDVWSSRTLSGTFNTGERVEGSVGYFYTVVGSQLESLGEPSATLFTVTHAKTLINGVQEQLYGCDYVAPPTIRTQRIYAYTLANGYPDSNTLNTLYCNQYPYSLQGGGYTQYGPLYVDGPTITPPTSYTLYTQNAGGQTYNGNGKLHAILLPGQSKISYIATISAGGAITDWSSCS
jgi:hypothetical protein